MDISSTYNIPAEREILGAVLLDNDCMVDIDLNPQDFSSPRHQVIFTIMQYLFNNEKVIDFTSIAEYLKGDVEKVGGISYLSELLVTTVRYDKNKVAIVKEKSNMRKLYKLLTETMEGIHNNKVNFDEAYNNIQNNIYEIQEESKDELKTYSDVMVKTLNYIDRNMVNGGKCLGLDTGISEIDNAINGLQKQKLYIIAGRPGMGKSALANTVMSHVCKNYNGLMYSLEMADYEIGLRCLAAQSMIDSSKLERGIDFNWLSMEKAISSIDKRKGFINDKSGIHINDIRRQATKLNKQGKLDLIMIDHLGIMNMAGMGKELREQVTNICIQLKNMAKEFDIPIILLSQLSRAPEGRADKRPMLSDLKESGGIEENADVVMLLYRDEYYNKETEKKNIIEINVAKQRGGRTGSFDLGWMPEYQLVTSIYRGGKQNE